MKLVFLDFDGVMNPYNNYKPECMFSRSAVKNLNTLLEKEPELRIVVSSSWRHKGIDFVKGVLSANGIDSDKVVGITTLEHQPERGTHVVQYLKNNKNVKHFVILDDQRNMGDVQDHLVKVSGHVGLTERNIEEAIEILKN